MQVMPADRGEGHAESVLSSLPRACMPWRVFSRAGDYPAGLPMTAYDSLVIAIAGTNGRIVSWMLRPRQRVMAWIKVRARGR